MQHRHFQTAGDLTDWVNLPANAGISVVAIVADASNGGFVLFFTP